ncbi:autotransporter outer membrane beta-barrel domain-containing protein [Pseudomonas sp. R11F]|uniref:autotransporter family protein n=1 Tax=Pseudomonas TaxID=286 RepID=UPI00398F64BB
MRTPTSPRLYLGIAASAMLATWPLLSQGACTTSPGPSGQIFTCTSGTTPGITALTGDNQVLFPSGNAVISGNIRLGPGGDLVQLDAPGTQVNASVDMGDGANIFRLNKGIINGDVTQGAGADVMQISGGQARAIFQGAGTDKLFMSGGIVESVDQGDGSDELNISGGWIKGAFLSGDRATMTGGRIGRVDMRLEKNLFDMSGGDVDGSVVTGFDKDTILISGTAHVGGNISTSGGDDFIQVTGGEIMGQILAGTGDDTFIWRDAGLIHGAILLGADNDTALLQNLSESTVLSTSQLDGGPGNDTLTLDNTQAGQPERFSNWETVRLDNNSGLKLGGTFVLGDSGSGTGTMTVDGSSTLLVDTGIISPFTSGQLATLNNGGQIDMTGNPTATHSLTVNGNYNGAGGRLALSSVLDGDGSPSDKLVVSQGTLSGTTSLSVTNLGGKGAATLQDGILVVQAINGATGAGTAFTSSGVSAGAFNYYLFKGGVTPGTEQNYYLRNTVPVTPPPDPVIVTPLPEPVPGTPPLPPNPVVTPVDPAAPINPIVKPIPLYREEVPLYSVLYPAVQQMVQGMLGTYHERQGDQAQQRQTGVFPTGWARVYGSNGRQGFTGTVNPTLNSSRSGYQLGTDLYAHAHDTGQTQRAGLFVGLGRLQGSIKGFNDGFEDNNAGDVTLRNKSLGVYWTLIGANRAYLDLVLMKSWIDGHSESDRGIKMKVKGRDVTASAEVGWPFSISPHWELEPQGQFIVGRSSLDSQNDGSSAITFHSDTNVTTRLGARLRGDYQVRGMPLQPYVRANVWHTSAGTNTVRFNGVTDIDTEQKSTTMELKVGATLKVAQDVSVYGELGYTRNLDSNAVNGRSGTVGVQVDF